jgi:hypothetical protein
VPEVLLLEKNWRESGNLKGILSPSSSHIKRPATPTRSSLPKNENRVENILQPGVRGP